MCSSRVSYSLVQSHHQTVAEFHRVLPQKWHSIEFHRIYFMRPEAHCLRPDPSAPAAPAKKL